MTETVTVPLTTCPRCGTTVRKVADKPPIFQTHFGITLSPGAIVQSNQRLAERAAPAYRDLALQARHSLAATCRQRRDRFTAFAQRLLCLPPFAPPLLLAPLRLPP